jgi:threonine/homoserine/homoserine lactone efflux protein
MAFLAAMAIAMFRFDPSTIEITDSGGKLGLKTGIIMQFVNGKEWAFVIIVMSEYIEPLGGGIIGIATIISITVSVCVLAMIAWTFFGDKLNNLFSDPVKGSRVFKICAILLTLLWLVFLVKGPAV